MPTVTGSFTSSSSATPGCLSVACTSSMSVVIPSHASAGTATAKAVKCDPGPPAQCRASNTPRQ
eukprot:5275636-Amphidinium_carterae.3